MADLLTVATVNLFQGAGLLGTYAAESLADMAAGLRDAYGRMRKNDFPGRAAAIAGLLAGHRPDVLGVQEAADWVCGPDERCDFLAVLLAELERVGLAYRPVAVAVTSTLGLHTDGDIVSLTDRNALLVRADAPAERLAVRASGHHIYATRLDVPLPSGLALTKVRGFGWADLDVAGHRLRVVNTHLEAFDGGVRAEQAEELCAALDAGGRASVVVGDFNGGPDDPAYQVFAGRGYADAWTVANGDAPGGTGVRSGLDDDDPELGQRIDYVLYRAPELIAGTATLVGTDPADRTPSGLWPSDHAGLVATFTTG